ncbi:bile acid:sodium symporter family protein [Novosphingobium tardum]|uniref:Bile acid:sodium symporter family protein n=1 Tax=Novosphingobium tardum TaxID=1538021 RepID=A0ABV8RPU8_9SPHN
MKRLLALVPDPMVRLLVVAIVMASLLPVEGGASKVAQWISNGAVFLLFFLNGLRLPRHEVIAGLSNLRLLGPLVLWVFGAMAFAGWAMSHAVAPWVPLSVATGFVFLGVLPSTVQSATAYTSLSGGNVASAVISAALLNILGVFVSAPLFALVDHGGAAVVDGSGLAKVVGTLLVPFILGQAGQRWLRPWVLEHRELATWMDRTSIAIAVYVAFSGAVVAGIWSLVGMDGWIVVTAATAIFLVFGYGGAWLLGGAIGLDRGNRITMLFSGAQKSIAMGAPLASVLFDPRSAGMILMPVLVYHLAQLVVSAPLATRLSAPGHSMNATSSSASGMRRL